MIYGDQMRRCKAMYELVQLVNGSMRCEMRCGILVLEAIVGFRLADFSELRKNQEAGGC